MLHITTLHSPRAQLAAGPLGAQGDQRLAALRELTARWLQRREAWRAGCWMSGAGGARAHSYNHSPCLANDQLCHTEVADAAATSMMPHSHPKQIPGTTHMQTRALITKALRVRHLKHSMHGILNTDHTLSISITSAYNTHARCG